jgi:hypothetical protein
MCGISSNMSANGRGCNSVIFLQKLRSRLPEGCSMTIVILVNFTAGVSDELRIAHDFATSLSFFKLLQQYSLHARNVME